MTPLRTLALAGLLALLAVYLHRAPYANHSSRPLTIDTAEHGAPLRSAPTLDQAALTQSSAIPASVPSTSDRVEATAHRPEVTAERAATESPQGSLLVAGKLEARSGERLLFSRVVVERIVLPPDAESAQIGDPSLGDRGTAGAALFQRVRGISGLPARDGTFALYCEEPQNLGFAAASGAAAPRSVQLQLTATARDHRSTSVRFEPGQRDVRVVLEPVGHLELETACEPQFEGTTLRLCVVDANGVETSRLASAGKKIRLESLALGLATLEVSLSQGDTTLVTLSDIQIRHGPCTDQRLQPLSLHGRMEMRHIRVTCDGQPLRAQDRVSLVQSGHMRTTALGLKYVTDGLCFVAAVGAAPVGTVRLYGYQDSPPTPLTEGLVIDLAPDRIVEVTLGPLPPTQGVYRLQAEALDDGEGPRVESDVSLAPGSATARLRNPPVGAARVRLTRHARGGTDGPGPAFAEGPWYPVVLPGPPRTAVALDVSP